MEETTRPAAKPAPLFSLDLGDNGGVFAPSDYEALHAWIQTETSFWSWLNQHRGSHDQGLRDAFGHLLNAQNCARESQQHLQSNPGHAAQRLDACLSSLTVAFLQCKLPHSSTPLAHRADALRGEGNEETANYFLSVFVQPQNGQATFQPQNVNAWRGIVEGVYERFQLAPSVQKSRKQAADQSFEQLRGKAEKLLGDKSEALNALHRDYTVLAESIEGSATKQQGAFDEAQTKRDASFEALVTEHLQEMEQLRKTFREEIALRAPADYWEKKRKGHSLFSILFGSLSFIGIALAAVGIGYLVHDLLKPVAANTSPEAWRLGLVILVSLFAVWFIRLIVRMFLSHLHLAADASERVVMTHTYLSLLEGDRLTSKEDRQLILQALFRPSSDGLVKDEGVPFSMFEMLTRQSKP